MMGKVSLSRVYTEHAEQWSSNYRLYSRATAAYSVTVIMETESWSVLIQQLFDMDMGSGFPVSGAEPIDAPSPRGCLVVEYLQPTPVPL